MCPPVIPPAVTTPNITATPQAQTIAKTSLIFPSSTCTAKAASPYNINTNVARNSARNIPFHPHHNEKHTKESSKQSHHTKSYHEDKFLSHLKPKKDHIQKHYDRWEREDLHLQDLNLESRIKKHQQNHKGSHSKNNGGHHEVERMVNHHPEHFDSKSWMQHEHNINTKAFSHAHVDHHHSHHKNHKSNSHHKNHKQGDKSMKNKRKKAHEKKFNKKHSKKHFV